ncbi:alpha/beta-hydrolase [Lentithecium fluviatile CBS 122367]|uniref:Alpha/beta-hydrolase n=1 Tax=Lentithecium fluviatile CBS 122367 TaxID=1168545 RepID=A0A6G1J2Q4_9PLEO|nr:alpha/beta-hydrolase [Lentithecium fluviatile CBS 122367]
MTSNKLTILLAHGSYHPAQAYTQFLRLLTERGYETHCPQLPTADRKCLVADPSNPSFEQPAPPGGHPQQGRDAEVLQALLKQLVEDEGNDVLLVAHSSGGWTACAGSTPEFQRERRKKEGKTGGVIGIFFMASFLILPGASVFSTFAQAEEPAGWFTFLPEQGLTILKNPLHYFFHDVPRAEAEEIIGTLTACPHLRSPLTNDAYSALPCAYMICEGDRVLPPVYQEWMIKNVEEESGRKMAVYRCTGGHESFLSQPHVYVDSIETFAQNCEKR